MKAAIKVQAMKKKLKKVEVMDKGEGVKKDLDFSGVIQTTDGGTVLEGQTMAAVNNELTNYLQGARIGIMTNIRFPWDEVFQETGEDVHNPNVQKLTSFVENNLKEYIKAESKRQSAEQEFQQNVLTHLHSIFEEARTNEMPRNHLIAAYFQKADVPISSYADTEDRLKGFLENKRDEFSVAGRPTVMVRRLVDKKKRPIKDAQGNVLKAFSLAVVGTIGGEPRKEFERYMANTFAKFGVSLNKSEFERCKTELRKPAITLNDMRLWLAKKQERTSKPDLVVEPDEADAQ